MKVLIVEDDKFLLKAISYKFSEEGFKVKVSETAEGGLLILRKWLPDVIILDILLPGIDGYAFLREVRNHPRWSKIPVIVASNLNEDPELKPGDKTDYADYVVKSDLDLDELVKKVRSYIK